MIMCLSESLFGFLLHSVCWASWICLSMSFLKFGKWLFQSLFHHLSFSLLLGTPQCIHWSVAMYHRLSFSLCSLFFIFPPLCSSDLFPGVLILSYTYSSLMNPVSDFFFFNSVIFFRSRIFVLFTISTSFLYSDFVHILFSWFLLLCCLSFHLSLKVRTVILKSFSSKAYAYVLQR